MFSKDLSKLLNQKEFISVATSDLQGEPNAAPKMLLKSDGENIYLVDYTIGKTWENLKVNPKISLSLSDVDSLKGYKIDGNVEIIEEGSLYDELFREVKEKQIVLSVDRVLEGVRRKRTHKNFELGIPDKFVVFKVKVQEITEIGPQGQLHRERVK